MEERIMGRCKWFSNDRGYGFVTADDDDKEYFVHYSKISKDGYKTLDEDQEVSFVVKEADDGKLQAFDVETY